MFRMSKRASTPNVSERVDQLGLTDRDARNEARKTGHTHATARGAVRTVEGKRIRYVKS